MIYKALVFTTMGLAVQANAAQTYVIDSASSYVQAYAPVWTNAGAASPGSGGETSYNWSIELKPLTFGISGTFQAETVAFPGMTDQGWLNLSNLNLTTTAPPYAGFSLPTQYSFNQNGELGAPQEPYPCSSSLSGVPVIFGCFIFVTPDIETQGGSYLPTEMTLTGGKSPLIVSGPEMFQVGPTEPPPWTDLSLLSNMYSYSIHANAVPEPAIWTLVLGGLAISTIFGRRNVRTFS